MRKMLTREVTKTTVKVAKINVVNGVPSVQELPEEILLGNVSLEKAQQELNKKHGEPITILEIKADTQVYELPVEKFLEIATIKVAETVEA